MRRYVCAIVTALCVFAGGRQVFAQATVQGVVVRDYATIWRTDAAFEIGVVRSGTMLQVTGASEHWYEIVVPRALGGRGERGLISRAEVRLDPADAQPPLKTLRGDPAERPANGAARRAVPARRARAPFPRGFIAVGGAYQATSNDFAETVTFHTNAEDGHFTSSYSVQRMRGFAASGGGMFSKNLGLGVTVERVSRTIPTTFDASIPHPFFFNMPRSVSAGIGGVSRDELAVHAQLRAVAPVTSRVEVAVSAGPSWFRVRQDVVSDFTYTDQYPYDTATFGSADVVGRTASRAGYNVGADVAVFVTKQVGVGAGAMFSRATVTLPVNANTSVSSRAGGVHVTAGVRFRF